MRLNRRLTDELALAGRDDWDVTVAAPSFFHGGNDLRPVHLEAGPDETIRLERLRAHLTRRVHVFFYERRLRRLLAEGWDVVHCWEEPYILAGAQVGWWTPRDALVVFRTAQNLAKRYPPPFNWIEEQAMRRADGWICCGQTVADTLNQKRVYRQCPMLLSPLGVDTNYFRPDPTAGDARRRELGWGERGPPVVGYLGRLTPEKGLRTMMDALDQLGSRWRALIVGAGPMEREVREWGAKHGDRVRVCTDVKHDGVPGHLNAMDLMVAPSLTARHWREQFGRMIVEAFACGVPVIGSDSGEIPYVVGEGGLIAAEGDVAAWREAIGQLLQSPVRRAELSAHGLRRAKTQYAWPVVARQYLTFFKQLLESGRKVP